MVLSRTLAELHGRHSGVYSVRRAFEELASSGPQRAKGGAAGDQAGAPLRPLLQPGGLWRCWVFAIVSICCSHPFCCHGFDGATETALPCLATSPGDGERSLGGSTGAVFQPGGHPAITGRTAGRRGHGQGAIRSLFDYNYHHIEHLFVLIIIVAFLFIITKGSSELPEFLQL